MRVIDTALPGVRIVEPDVYRDDRGFFRESYHEERFAEHDLAVTFRQDNHSRSRQHVLRGLHFQLRRPQGKLVTCVSGEIFDVAVDVRRGSPAFGRWTGVVLRGDEPRSLWIPGGFAHGFCVLSESADVVYKCTDVFDSADEHGVLWSDPTVAIRWPVAHPILSAKDAAHPVLDDARTDLPGFPA